MGQFQKIIRSLYLPRCSALARAGSASAALLAMTIVSPGVDAQSTRPESVARGVLSVERGCPITPEEPEAQRDARTTRFGPILGTILAGVAGNLVTSGFNAVGNALESASQEKAFVAEGLGSFTAYRIDNGGKPGELWKAIPDLEVNVRPDGETGTVDDGATGVVADRCLILIFPAAPPARGKSSGPGLTQQAIETAFKPTGINATRSKNAVARLKALGLTQLPALYVEAELQNAADGMVIRPVLIRYGTPLPGAPKGASATELHISFGTPGAPDTTDIGPLFAVARLPLPKIAPGSMRDSASTVPILDRVALAPYTSVVLPLRPTAGLADTALTSRNAIVTAIDTNTALRAQLKEALRIAQRKVDDNTDASQTVTLRNARDDADLAHKEAIAQGAKLMERAKKDDLLYAGSTNIKARFVVIRDANQFGLALAKALKAQADTAGTMVTERLKPKPEWTAQDTAFVEAQTSVRAAERAVDEAIAAGKTTEVPGLQDALTKAKAKANEAAVAAGHSPPYLIVP